MKRLFPISAIVFLLMFFLAVCSCKKDTSPATRSFYLGVTPWPPDFTAQGKELAYDFIGKNCDMVSHHFDDGVPWEEFLTGAIPPAVLTADVTERLERTPAGKKILLSVAPLNISRLQKANYRSDVANDPRQSVWQQKRFSHPDVIRSYEHYLDYLISSFHPDFLNYGVESNHGSWQDSAFSDYKTFLDSVYHYCKNRYPALPCFVSLMVSNDAKFLERAKELEPFTDWITISAYPYSYIGSPDGGSTSPKLMPADLFESYAGINPLKPFAVAETGWIAENLDLPPLHKKGTPQWQEDYMNYLLDFCAGHSAKFVIWFCAYDYDAAIHTFQAIGYDDPLSWLWKDTGMIDEQMRDRPALQVWKKWLKKPVQ